MAFDFTLMNNNVKAMRDMNPVKFTYRGVQYNGFRDVLSSQLQMSLYGGQDVIDITVGVVRSDLKVPTIEKGDEVVVYTPETGRKGREMIVEGIREDAGGLTLRLDLRATYYDDE